MPASTRPARSSNCSACRRKAPTILGYQGTTAPKYGTWGFDLAGRDTSVNPGDNFMRFANGTALDAMQIPSDRTSYGSFALLRELSDNRVKAMIDGLAARTDLTPGSDEQKIADAYRSYMDEARIEALDAQPIQPLPGRHPGRRHP